MYKVGTSVPGCGVIRSVDFESIWPYTVVGDDGKEIWMKETEIQVETLKGRIRELEAQLRECRPD